MENSKILWTLALEVDHRVENSLLPCFGGRSSGRKHFAPSVQRSIIDVTQFPGLLTKPSFKIPALGGRWMLIGQIPADP